jgi:hypothetical protein
VLPFSKCRDTKRRDTHDKIVLLAKGGVIGLSTLGAGYPDSDEAGRLSRTCSTAGSFVA